MRADHADQWPCSSNGLGGSYRSRSLFMDRFPAAALHYLTHRSSLPCPLENMITLTLMTQEWSSVVVFSSKKKICIADQRLLRYSIAEAAGNSASSTLLQCAAGTLNNLQTQRLNRDRPALTYRGRFATRGIKAQTFVFCVQKLFFATATLIATAN